MVRRVISFKAALALAAGRQLLRSRAARGSRDESRRGCPRAKRGSQDSCRLCPDRSRPAGGIYQGISYTTWETVIDLGPIEATAERDKRSPFASIGWRGCDCGCDPARDGHAPSVLNTGFLCDGRVNG